MQLTEDMAGMDAESKGLLRNREVLAVILKGVVAEYEGYSREEIIQFIEPDSIRNEMEVSPGRTNTKEMGDCAEFAELNEKISYFDLAFRAKNPVLSKKDVQVNLYVDMESQNPFSDMGLSRDVYWKILRNQLTVTGTWNSAFLHESEDDWNYVLKYLKERTITPAELITHRLPLEKMEEGFHIMRDKTEDYVKILGIW